MSLLSVVCVLCDCVTCVCVLEQLEKCAYCSSIHTVALSKDYHVLCGCMCVGVGVHEL